MEKSFVNPPKARDPLNPQPRKRGTYDSKKVNESLKRKAFKGIKVPNIQATKKNNDNITFPYMKEIVFATTLIIYFLKSRFIMKETVKSNTIALIDAKLQNIFKKIYIPELFSKPLFASLFSITFYTLCSVFVSNSTIPLITTIIISFDTRLSNFLLSSYGFSIAASLSLLSVYFSIKSIVCEEKSLLSYFSYQLSAVFFASAATLFRYELLFLFFLVFISFIIKVTRSSKNNNMEKVFVGLVFVISITTSFGALLAIDAKKQLMEIAFDIPLWRDGISIILEMDSNGFLFASIIGSTVLLFITKFDIKEYCAISALVILAIAAQCFPLSITPEKTLRSIVVRISLIALSSAIMSKDDKTGVIAASAAGIYGIIGLFITMPNTFLNKLI